MAQVMQAKARQSSKLAHPPPNPIYALKPAGARRCRKHKVTTLNNRHAGEDLASRSADRYDFRAGLRVAQPEIAPLDLDLRPTKPRNLALSSTCKGQEADDCHSRG